MGGAPVRAAGGGDVRGDRGEAGQGREGERTGGIGFVSPQWGAWELLTLTPTLTLRERGFVDIFAYPCEPVKGEGTYAIVSTFLAGFIRFHFFIFKLIPEDLAIINEGLDLPVYADSGDDGPGLFSGEPCNQVGVGQGSRCISAVAGVGGFYGDVAGRSVRFGDFYYEVGLSRNSAFRFCGMEASLLRAVLSCQQGREVISS